jgi:hypothetical protein
MCEKKSCDCGGQLDGFRLMACSKCGYEWTAICYKDSKFLECGKCGHMQSVEEKIESNEHACKECDFEGTDKTNFCNNPNIEKVYACAWFEKKAWLK